MTERPPMAALELSLLGTFQVTLNGAEVAGFRTDKMRALLAYLSIGAAHAHRREALMGLLWPDQPEEAASVNLRQALFKLRQLLGDQEDTQGFLLITPLTVQFNPASNYRLDATTFADLVASSRAHRHRKMEWCSTCHTRLKQAGELYRGDLLQGFNLEDSQPFDEWLVVRRERFRRDAVEVCGLLAAYYAAHGQYQPALEHTYRQLELEPWSEELHLQAMWLLAVSGRRGSALAQYQTCKQLLKQELDIEPAPETTALFERIKAGDDGSGISDLVSEDEGIVFSKRFLTPRHNLPQQLTPFIGRADDLRRISERLENPDYRLVTLVGPGGVGKTRLVMRAAEDQLGAFEDGLFWVPLHSIASPEMLALSIAQATGLHFEGGSDPESQLINYLQDKEMLLVLDNFEHLLGAHVDRATNLLLSILKNAPRVSILVTSRERLGLQAEFPLDVSGLPFPDDGRWTMGDDSPRLSSDALASYGAVQLFVERGQQAHSEFALSGDTAPGVVDICRLVGGLPLGIVLAAAWVRHSTPGKIAESIKSNLDFLASSYRDASPQHASLRAVFNHSWNLLSEEERRVFRRLSVFRGGWEEEAAQDILDFGFPISDLDKAPEIQNLKSKIQNHLLSLVDKSLLRRDARGRFDIHEVLRQYAAEKLDEAPGDRGEIEHHHAGYYLGLAQLAEPELRGEEQGKWLELLEREQDNLRAVLHWAKENEDPAIGVRLGAALWRLWYVRSYYGEGREQLAAMLAIEDAAESGNVEFMRAKAAAVNGAGVLAFVEGDKVESRALFEESLALSRSLGDKQGTASMLNNLGIMAHQGGDPGEARTLYEESLAIRRELGDKWGVASSLNNLGLLAQEAGEYGEARTLHEESLAIKRELRDTLGIAASLASLGLVAQEQGEYDEARHLYEASLTLRREIGDKGGMAELFSNMGLVARKQGNYDDARDLYEKSMALARELGYRWSIALALGNLGVVAQERGDYDEARTLHKESLTLHRDLGEKVGVAGSLTYLGAVAVGIASTGLEQSKKSSQEQSVRNAPDRLGQLERAATLFGSVDRLLESMTAVLSGDERQVYDQNLAIARSSLNEEAFARTWSEGRAMSTEQAIEFALED